MRGSSGFRLGEGIPCAVGLHLRLQHERRRAMNNGDAVEELMKLDEEWCTTIRYHQVYDRWWNRLDRAVKIGVSFLAVLGLVVSNSHAYWVGVVSLFLSMALNILPFSDWRYHHHLLFQQWTELRSRLLVVMLEIQNLPVEKALPKGLLKKMKRLRKRDHQLSANEPPPNRNVLIRCQGDELESRWGLGVRTPEAVNQLRSRLPAAQAANEA